MRNQPDSGTSRGDQLVPPPRTDELISAMTNRIVEAFRPVKVVLFGSYARGEVTRDSDVDLLVVLPQVEDRREATVAIRRLLRDFPIAKDVVVTSPDELAEGADLIGTVLRPALPRGRDLCRQGDTLRTHGQAEGNRLQHPAALKEIDRSVYF